MDQKRLSKSFHFFIYPHQAARAQNIRRRNGRQSPLYLLAAQDAPPSSGKLNAHIAELWADVRLTLWSPWVKMRNVRCEQMFSALLPNSDPARSRWHVANVPGADHARSEEHTSELQSPDHLVCRLLLEKKKAIVAKIGAIDVIVFAREI